MTQNIITDFDCPLTSRTEQEPVQTQTIRDQVDSFITHDIQRCKQKCNILVHVVYNSTTFAANIAYLQEDREPVILARTFHQCVARRTCYFAVLSVLKYLEGASKYTVKFIITKSTGFDHLTKFLYHCMENKQQQSEALGDDILLHICTFQNVGFLFGRTNPNEKTAALTKIMEDYEASATEKYYDVNYSSQVALSHLSTSSLSASSPKSLFGLPELPIFKSMPVQ